MDREEIDVGKTRKAPDNVSDGGFHLHRTRLVAWSAMHNVVRGRIMIRADFCEYLFHPNDLLSLFPDSVKFVNVGASSVARVDPMDIVGMNQEVEIRTCPEKE